MEVATAESSRKAVRVPENMETPVWCCATAGGTGRRRCSSARQLFGRSEVLRRREIFEVLPERVTILAETALRPEEIDTAAADGTGSRREEVWNEAGDNYANKYEQANPDLREAPEGKLASAEGKSL